MIEKHLKVVFRYSSTKKNIFTKQRESRRRIVVNGDLEITAPFTMLSPTEFSLTCDNVCILYIYKSFVYNSFPFDIYLI